MKFGPDYSGGQLKLWNRTCDWTEKWKAEIWREEAIIHIDGGRGRRAVFWSGNQGGGRRETPRLLLFGAWAKLTLVMRVGLTVFLTQAIYTASVPAHIPPRFLFRIPRYSGTRLCTDVRQTR